MKCCRYLRNVDDKMGDDKTAFEKRLDEKCEGPSILFWTIGWSYPNYREIQVNMSSVWKEIAEGNILVLLSTCGWRMARLTDSRLRRFERIRSRESLKHGKHCTHSTHGKHGKRGQHGKHGKSKHGKNGETGTGNAWCPGCRFLHLVDCKWQHVVVRGRWSQVGGWINQALNWSTRGSDSPSTHCLALPRCAHRSLLQCATWIAICVEEVRRAVISVFDFQLSHPIEKK